MSEFTFFEVHFHEFNPTNTAPLVGRGGSARELGRRGTADPDPDLDDVPVEEAEAETGAEDGSGGLAGLLAVLVLLLALAVAARKFFGGDDELAELERIDDAA